MYFHACKVEAVDGRERLSTGVEGSARRPERTISDGF